MKGEVLRKKLIGWDSPFYKCEIKWDFGFLRGKILPGNFVDSKMHDLVTLSWLNCG